MKGRRRETRKNFMRENAFLDGGSDIWQWMTIKTTPSTLTHTAAAMH